MTQIVMPENVSKPNVLARWRFTAEQWREFVYYEKLEFENRTFADVRMLLPFGVIGIFVIALIGASKGGVPVFFFVMIAGSLFFGFCYLIHRLVRKSAEQRMNKQTGEVKVFDMRVDINGTAYDWRTPWSVPTIYKDYIYIGETKMLVLNFTSTGWITIKGNRHKIEKNFLVPVEPGKESEADFVIAEITERSFNK